MKKVIVICLGFIITLLSACESTINPIPALSGNGIQPQSVPNPPKHIALLLPLGGSVANEARQVQNGFFSNYYRAKETNGEVPQVTVLDSSNADLYTLYQQATTKGADLVVGPLMKDNVKTLENRGRLPVPVLALNTIDLTGRAISPSVYEFGLSPQDEALQVADRAHRDGRQRALVFVPAGPWGEGIARSFEKQWNAEGGTINDIIAVGSDQSINDLVKNALHFRDTDATGNITRNTQGAIRQDIDMVFIAVPPVQARQIKPMFAFYKADNIPFYSISLIFSGKINPQADKDLNDIIFCDMPSTFVNTGDNHSKLYAFGQDAYSLAMQLTTLINGASLQGSTGKLYLDNNMHVRRQLMWGTFRDGVPVAINQ